MADGSKKPIEDVEVGDEVIATDPETGEQAAKRVEHVFVHDDTVIDLAVDGEVVTTTEDHPFWSATDQRFERADELSSGEEVLAANGHLVTVSGLKYDTARPALAYNLAVEGIHTYHVGDAEVLVHNACQLPSKPLTPNQMDQAIKRGHAPTGIVRVDTPGIPGEKLHVHFKNGAALNQDGTWKHGSATLTRDQEKWLKANGWTLPQ